MAVFNHAIRRSPDTRHMGASFEVLFLGLVESAKGKQTSGGWCHLAD